MSIWADLGKNIIGNLGGAINQRIGSAINPPQQQIVAAAAGVGARVLPAIGRVLGSRTVAAATTGVVVGQMIGAGGAAGGSCPVGHHPNKQAGARGPKGTYCVRNRRMNVGNSRAARRAVRRLKGARKLLRDIEKMMPTRTTKSRAPVHHHHPAAGG